MNNHIDMNYKEDYIIRDSAPKYGFKLVVFLIIYTLNLVLFIVLIPYPPRVIMLLMDYTMLIVPTFPVKKNNCNHLYLWKRIGGGMVVLLIVFFCSSGMIDQLLAVIIGSILFALYIIRIKHLEKTAAFDYHSELDDDTKRIANKIIACFLIHILHFLFIHICSDIASETKIEGVVFSVICLAILYIPIGIIIKNNEVKNKSLEKVYWICSCSFSAFDMFMLLFPLLL